MASIDSIAAVYENALGTRLGLPVVRLDQRLLKVEIAEGLVVLFRLHPRDPEYFFMFAVLPVCDGLEPEAMARICLRETRDKKLVKVTLDEDGDIWFTVEMLVAGQDRLPDAEHLAQVIPRALDQLQSAVVAVVTSIQLEQMLAGS